jgi:hypothetical protein
MFEPELEPGAIRAVLSDWSLPEVDLWALFPTGRMMSAKAHVFVAFVETALRRRISAGNSQGEINVLAAGHAFA